MITVIGVDGSPLCGRALDAVAGATLLVGGPRHLAAAGVAADEAGPLDAGPAQPGLVQAGRVPPGSVPPGSVPPGSVPPGGVPPGGVPPGGVPPGGVPPARVPPGTVPLGGPGTAVARTTIPQVIVLGPLRPALDALAAHDGDAVVLASGDPGFFGIVRALRERGLGCVVLPAVSSVALVFARAGLPWDDAVVVSAHGRDLRPAVNVCRAHPKVAVLTGPGQGPAEIGAALAGWERRLVVAEDLGRPRERITECTPAEAAARAWTDPNVVLALALPSARPTLGPPVPVPAPSAPSPSTAPSAPSDEGGQFVINRLVSLERHQSVDHEEGRSPTTPNSLASHGSTTGPSWCWPLWAEAGDRGWALPEGAFEHRDSMVTKPEVRALALARLGPGPGQLIWDVGAGSGSVAVECARFGAAVIAVERDPAQRARVAANAQRHGTEVRVVEGAVPEALGGLPDADAVFVGGGGLAVVGAVAARGPARIVLALAAVQRAGQAMELLGDAGYTVDGTLLQASRLAPLPDGAHRLAAANPVFLLWATHPRPAQRPYPARRSGGRA
jgi:precorrin-6Y C5,15-methyltransferase (decarboxylating)